MSVASGRELLNIPGPTNIPDAVLAAMHRPAIDIYSGEMLGITRSLHEDLPKVFRTAARVYIYAATGKEAPYNASGQDYIDFDATLTFVSGVWKVSNSKTQSEFNSCLPGY